MTPKAKETVNIANVHEGGTFEFGGVPWIALGLTGGEWIAPEGSERKTYYTGGILAVTKDIVCNKAFDEGNCNDWRKSSLRKWLNSNDGFLGKLAKQRTNKDESEIGLIPVTSDLVANNGMNDYGTAEDYVALITCDLYRKYRAIIPKADEWWWTLTPRSCGTSTPCLVRAVDISGAFNHYYANYGGGGVRPLCLFKFGVSVYVTATEDAAENADNRLLRDYFNEQDGDNAFCSEKYAGKVLMLEEQYNEEDS